MRVLIDIGHDLVAKDFKQRYKIYYEDIFSPIIKSVTIGTVLPMVVSIG